MSKRNWERSGVTHTELCGCKHEQYIEEGATYHELWVQIRKCGLHGFDPRWRGES